MFTSRCCEHLVEFRRNFKIFDFLVIHAADPGKPVATISGPQIELSLGQSKAMGYILDLTEGDLEILQPSKVMTK